MAQIEVSRLLPFPHEQVWEALADLSSHDQWMKDAVGIEFDTDQRRGSGTSMAVETRVGPLRTIDRIEVTDWVEGQSISVVHTGMVKGTGTLAANPEGSRTRVIWTEELFFPWWFGGRIGARIASPVLAAIWRGNLERLEAGLSSL